MSLFRSKGFTLIELIVVVTIVAIFVAIGIPSLRDLMIKTRLSGQVQEFYGTIDFARSEAIKRGTNVSICKSNDQSSCCQVSGSVCTSWSGGWIVFADQDSDGSRDDIGGPNEEPLLRVFPTLPTGYTLYPNGNFTNYITYDRFGMANNTGTFAFCANSDESKARAITITRTRPRIATSTETISTCESP